MADRETNLANFARTTLSAEMGASDTTANVDSTSGFPSSPAFLVIEPDSPSQREVVLFDGTFSSTAFTTTTTNNRYLSGSAAGSGLTHPTGSAVICAPLAQHIDDAHDRIDADAAHDHDTDYAALTHAARHQNGGADEVSVAGLSGELADDQPPKAHTLGGASHSADTLADLNAKVSDATLDDSSATRDPTSHADAAHSTDYVHEVNGSLRGYVEPGATPGNTGTVDLDLSANNVFEVTPTGDITFTFSGLPSAGDHASATIIVHNATYALTWPAGTEHPGGEAPALDGKTYLSLVVEADGTVVVGQAWAGVA